MAPTMKFSEVLTELVAHGSKPAGSPGPRFARHGWNGKDLHIEGQWPDEHSKMTKPYLFMETPDGSRIPWVPSSGDLFAADWYLLP